MTNNQPAGRKWVSGLAALLMLGGSAQAALNISASNQTGSVPFTPDWTLPANSLIDGLAPSSAIGNFSHETSGRNPLSLTANVDLTISSVGFTASTNYVTCGNGAGAGSELIYTLPASAYGYDVTNITVIGGWQDNGRDAQAYTVFYSTAEDPEFFHFLASVDYNPSVPSGIASGTLVTLSDSAGMPIAANVAALKFDFTSPGVENGYAGYGAIYVQGTASTNVVTPPALVAPVEQTIFPTSTTESADAVLVFNEIMYHPESNEARMEFIEFYNQLAVDIDISNWRVSGDTDYTFPENTRVAGRSFIVLARNPAQLQAATGLSSNVFGPFISPLDNKGNTLLLFNHVGRLMDTVEFGTEDEWPVTPDGAGPSVAKIDRDWGSAAPANWRASRENGGTPGRNNFSEPPALGPVVFNEIAGTTNATFWLELMNHGTNSVALGGWIIHHDGVVNTDYVIPGGTTLAPGAFLQISNDTLGFQSVDSGEKLFLFGPDFSVAHDGVVLKKSARARYGDGSGEWLVPSPLTPGASNQFAFHTDLVINEIMFNHKEFPAADTNLPPADHPEEWIELHNRGTNLIDLTGWELKGGIDYTFTAGRTLAPGAYLIVAGDAVALAADYPAADIVGNFSGRLGSDDRIILRDADGNPADQVHYYDDGAWPKYAGGGGSSLELRDPFADNSKAEAWAASDESGKSSWQTYTYRKIAQPSATPSPDNQWRDFIMGLLGDGECWVDDISVVQSPTTNPVQLINNGNFENGLAGWRVLGNHGRSRVEPDPTSPGNHALHLVASGAQEHMHNHIETTLAGNRAVTNGLLYEISFRARWIAGNSLLNSRLYFNRVARTTPLEVPPLNGTPGTINSRYSPNIGPTFSHFQHQPVIPRANQSVTVFVRADDPHGVNSCSVWWSVNGGNWSSAAMLLTNGSFAGTLPGLPVNSLVQFYVQAVDGLGAVSTYPARGPESGAFYRVQDGFINQSPAHSLRILMSPANIAHQYAVTNLMSNESLPCTVIYDERQVYYDAAVRLKSSQRGRVEDGRIGFHLQFKPDQLFRGVHPVLLLDRSAGGSRPPGEEILLKHMVAKAGVPGVNPDICRIIAPRPAQNGMAILSPRFEDTFIENAFENGGDGTLFEMEITYYPLTANAAGYKLPAPDNVQGVDTSDLGDDKETYRYNFLIKNHRDADDYRTFMRFAKSWSLNGSALEEQTRITMDVDQWLRAYALVSLCGVNDMYTFGIDHNLMLYQRPDGKMLYFPWDMDHSFNRSANESLVGDRNLSKIVNLPGNLRRFYAHVLDHIDGPFNSGYMNYWASHYSSLFGRNYVPDLDYITARGNYAINAIKSAGGDTPFNVNGGSELTISSNLVTLSGSAPVSMTTILINGKSYPVKWTSISSWTVQVPVNSGTNALMVQGFDLNGNLLTNLTRTVIYNGPEPDAEAVVFNEIMAHPAAGQAQFVELLNTSTNFHFDLSGWRLNGVGYTFPSGTILAPKQLLVLAKDRLAFESAFGAVPLLDVFTGNLDPQGETLTLFRPDTLQTNQEIVVDRVRYESTTPWPGITNGASLQLIDAARDNSRVANWRAVRTEEVPAPQWVRVSATGIPRPSSSSRPFYIYLQSAGEIHIDDLSLVAGPVAESGVNLVPNGGFENTLSPWTIGSDNNNIASEISTTIKRSGNSSLHLVASSGGTTRNSSIWQDFSGSLAIGGTYTLSFWYLPTTHGGPLTARFSLDGIILTTNPAPAAASALATPAMANSVASTLPAFPALWLNELQSVNVTGPTNNFGIRAPWVELHNVGTNTLNLSGLYLSDSYTNLTRWAFPANVSIPAEGFLVVWCDGQTQQSTPIAPHANFNLSAETGAVILSRLISNNVPQIVDYLNYNDLAANWSYGSFPDGQPFYRQKMFKPTPGATNSSAAPPITISINEWMADNSRTLPNPLTGTFDDWFELYNYGTNTVDLGGYYLTGDLANKTKFKVPDNQHYLVPPKGFMVVWADDRNASNSPERPDLHVNFKLSKSGEVIGLYAADGVLIDAVSFGPQTTDVTQGRFPDGGLDIFSMPTPTPQTNNIIPNTAPVLSVIADKHVHAGQTIQFIATATDAQSDYQTLAFSLINPPNGAGIHPSSGAFSWTTTDAQANSTNTIILRVTDNGVPPMNDEVLFVVVVGAKPQFSGVSAVGNGRIEISFHTLPGQNYQLQFKDQLSDASWTPIGGVIAGTGALSVIADNGIQNGQRFYRLVVLP